MTKTQLQKIKELDAFLKKRNMELRGENNLIGFNRHNYREEEYVSLDLVLGFVRGYHSTIDELNKLPKIKESYYIDKNGKLKSLN